MAKEELLRHVRALYECSLTPEDLKSALEQKFPELIESEEERNNFNKLDKIYVRIAEDDNFGTASIEPRPFTKAYIRKDALLEWAKTEGAKCSDETHPYAQFMNVVIDKLNLL